MGSIGHLAAFSFHETKNIISGEGGMLVINDERFIERSEIIWEKGTNRAAFSRREVNKYNWIDIGSSFLPSELTAAFLLAQLENLDGIQQKRKVLWQYYYKGLKLHEDHKKLSLPVVNSFATNNGHMFYLICRGLQERSNLLLNLNNRGIQAIFHYLPLHDSPFFKQHNTDLVRLANAERYGESLVRLPLYFELAPEKVQYIIDMINHFLNERAELSA